jgi:hypothetical protein
VDLPQTVSPRARCISSLGLGFIYRLRMSGKLKASHGWDDSWCSDAGRYLGPSEAINRCAFESGNKEHGGN